MQLLDQESPSSSALIRKTQLLPCYAFVTLSRHSSLEIFWMKLCHHNIIMLYIVISLFESDLHSIQVWIPRICIMSYLSMYLQYMLITPCYEQTKHCCTIGAEYIQRKQYITTECCTCWRDMLHQLFYNSYILEVATYQKILWCFSFVDKIRIKYLQKKVNYFT